MGGCFVELTPVNQRRNASVHIFVPANEPRRVYDAVINITDDHETACEISSWAELACGGEVYETDDVIAEIVYD